MNTTSAPPAADARLCPALRDRDRRPIDSVDRSVAAVEALPRWRRLLTHPAVLWAPAVVLFSAGQIVLLIAFLVLGEDPENQARLEWTGFIANIIGYACILVLLERRRPLELTRRPIAFLFGGLALGAVAIAATVGTLHMLGAVEWGRPSTDVPWAWLLLSLGINPAIGEELMFRGVLFRYAEQGLGTIPALLLSGGLFGAVHLGNPNATAWGAAAIAIEAGLMLGALYALTRSLWVVIGVHCTWNVLQGAVFGYNVSGVDDFSGWLSPTPVGDPLLSGGTFGAEASVVALVLCTVVTVVSLVLLIRRGGMVRAAWTRGNRRPAVGAEQH